MDIKPDTVFMELLGACTAVQLWGKGWKELDVKLNCDDMGVVKMLKRKCCNFRRKDLMESVRILCRSAVENDFYIRVDHVKGLDNKVADGLSRKDNVDLWDEKYLNGNGYNCDDVIDDSLDFWYNNMPFKLDIIESDENIGCFMSGWDNYEKERMKNKQYRWNYKC